MAPVVFEPTISAGDRPQIHYLDRLDSCVELLYFTGNLFSKHLTQANREGSDHKPAFDGSYPEPLYQSGPLDTAVGSPTLQVKRVVANTHQTTQNFNPQTSNM